MTYIEKYSLLEKMLDVFKIKTGDILKNGQGKCYKATKLFSNVYGVIMIGPIQIIWIFTFLYLPFYGIVVNSFLVLVIHFVLELVLVGLVPMKEVPCWEKRLQERRG